MALASSSTCLQGMSLVANHSSSPAFGLLSVAADVIGCWFNRLLTKEISMVGDIDKSDQAKESSWDAYGYHLRRLTAPVASEYAVNTYTTSWQVTPAISALTGGGYVIVWSSNGQDGSHFGIYAQRYTSNGEAYGSEFRVNSVTSNEQTNPAIAGLTDGGFVIVWNSLEQDGSGYGVYAQQYAASSSPIGSSFLVNTYTTNNQFWPAIAGLNDGGFVIVWENDGQDYGIYGQRYDSSGAKYGSEFHVNTYLSDTQIYPAVAALADGGYIVTWQSNGQDGSRYGVYAQRYASSNAKYGSEFQVNAFTSGDQRFAEVAGLSNGGFVITWQSEAQDGSGSGIFTKCYSSSSVAGSELRVNTYTYNEQYYPEVASFASGGFIITWHSLEQDGSGQGVFAQRYSAACTPYEEEFQVNTYTSNDQRYPAVAALESGAAVITWESYPQDGDYTGIYAKLYGANYFVFTQAPTSVPTESPTAHPTGFPTLIPTAMPSGWPTALPTSIPTSPTAIPTSLPSISPSRTPSTAPTTLSESTDVPTSAPSERLIQSSSSKNVDDNIVLIAWTVPVSLVGCLLIVLAVYGIHSRRKKQLEQQSKYLREIQLAPQSKDTPVCLHDNKSSNKTAVSAATPTVLGCDINDVSLHRDNGLIENVGVPTAADTIADVECGIETPSSRADTNLQTTAKSLSFSNAGSDQESVPGSVCEPNEQVSAIDTKIDDCDDETRSSVSSITEAGFSFATPKLSYNCDEEDDKMVIVLQTPIRKGMTSSGLAYVVRGILHEGGTDIPVVVKFLPKKHISYLQHELDQLLLIEEKMKRLSHCRNTIVQPQVSHLVSANSACEVRFHRRDEEIIDNWVGLVLESGDRNVKQLLEQSRIPHHQQLAILADLLNSLHILEINKVVHMDVKPTNMVLSQFCCKLVDFDISMRRGEPIPTDGSWTARYASPEIAKYRRDGGTLCADHKMDMWSFGMIAVEICCGRDFWSMMGVADNDIEHCLCELLQEDIAAFLDQYVNKDEDAALRSVLMSTLVINPKRRSASSAVLGKSYFNARDSTVINRRVQIADEIRDTMARILVKMDDVINMLKKHDEILTSLLTGRYMLPSLFVIVPCTQHRESFLSFFSFNKAMLSEYRLYFVCPVTKHLAKCGPRGRGYKIRIPKEWLVAAAPAIKFCLCAIKIIVSAYGIPPAMIPTLGANNWSEFGDTIQQCLRRDGGDAGERAFCSLEDCLSEITDSSHESLSKLSESLQNVTSKSFDQIASLVQTVEGVPQPVHPSWRPKMTGLVEVTCTADGSTMWVHESVAEEYQKRGKSMLSQLPPV